MTKLSANPNKIFTSVSNASLQENWFDKTHVRTFSCKPGELVPCLILPVVPGDVVDLSNIMVNRFPALIAPAFVDCEATVHYFYGSNRVAWESFDEWFEDPTGSGFTVPRLTVTNTLTAAQQRQLDFYGVPPIADSIAKLDLDIVAFPFSLMTKIYNDWYRPRPFENPIGFELPAAGGNIGATQRTLLLNTLLRSYEHDYQSSMLTEPLVAPEVNIPLTISIDPDWIINGSVPKMSDGAIASPDGSVLQSTSQIKIGPPAVGLPVSAYDPDGSLITQGTVNALREAYARMRYLEKMGRVGGEYYEIIDAIYNTRISDARLQRTEYITGTKVHMTINPVLATANNDATTSVGDQAGHMVGAGSGGGKQFHVEEHGYIIAVYSLRPKPVYSQGVERHFRAFDREDYIIPDLANIGEQAVTSFEITAYEQAQNALSTIGYLPNYTHHKQKMSSIAGEFRDSLAQYVVVKEYSGVPTLDKAFVQVQTNIMDHIFVANADVTDPIWVNMLHKINHKTCLPVYSDPI